MAHQLITSRRGFLRGAASAAGAAALYGTLGKQSENYLANLLGGAKPTLAQAGTYPANKMSALLSPVSNEITLHAAHVVKEIAPGLAYQLWPFESQSPGPHLHVQQGETVKFTMVNNSDMIHSIDFHAAQIAWDRYYQAIHPGETFSFDWTPNFPGVFMYHCGTPPVIAHIGNGMHGAIVVQPAGGWSQPAREFVLVQHEWYLGQRDDQGVTTGDSVKMSAGTPDLVVFNGYFNQYMEDPLLADPGELIRIHITNSGPTQWSAFHVIGALFEAAYPDGNPANRQVGMQTVSVPPGGGYTVELRIPDEGFYPFVTHSFAQTGRGALGLLKIGNPEPIVQEGSSH